MRACGIRGRVSPTRRSMIVGAAVSAVLTIPLGALAQPSAAGRVQGRVLDTTGAPLPSVLVEVESDAAPLTGRTAADGRYLIEAVPPGTYAVRFSLTNFVTVLRRNVTVAAEGATTQDATLYVAASASVVVTGRSTFRNLATVSTRTSWSASPMRRAPAWSRPPN